MTYFRCIELEFTRLDFCKSVTQEDPASWYNGGGGTCSPPPSVKPLSTILL